jgi:glucokinase
LILGVDLGGTKILTAVVEPDGRMVSRDHSVTPAAKGPDAVVQAILDSAERALRQAGIPPSSLRAIGIGAPGLSDPSTGILFTSPNLPGWENVPLRDIVEEKFAVKTFLINDGNAAALGEFYFGAGRRARNFIYVTVSTGIGGGIMIGGRIYTGAAGTAGEVGHMTIDPQGPPCNCGNTGCWEQFGSGTALTREARSQILAGAKTSILDHAGGEMERVNPEAIHRAARNGDSLARDLIVRTGTYVGIGLANLINLFNPELVVIGGGLSNIGDLLLEPAYREAERRSFRQSYRSVRFSGAQLGRNSGVLGAAAFANDERERGSGGWERRDFRGNHKSRPEKGESLQEILFVSAAALPILAVGGAAGNIICIHNVVAVLTMVGLLGREGRIVKKNFWIAIGYGLLAGVLAWIFLDLGGL